MIPILISAFVLTMVAMVLLQWWRMADNRAAARAWQRLRKQHAVSDGSFNASMVADLPEPARNYFLFTIAPGARLRTVAEIEMIGELSLGTKKSPNYGPMSARQILAPPFGLVWQLSAGKGLMSITGSDGLEGSGSWVRFWLMKTFPVVRVGGTADHLRAAFGRVVAESVFWSPASLLPQNGVTWEALDTATARATVSFNDLIQTVDITIGTDGRPVKVVIPRWSDANPEKKYKTQPFGGYLSDFRSFDGYRLATCVEGGNFIGTNAYFPFYKARVQKLRWVDS